MPSQGLTNPRTQIDTTQGSGRWNIRDREFQRLRIKAQNVLEGRESFSVTELGLILARLLTEV